MVISHMSLKIVNQIKRSNPTGIKSIAEDPTIKESKPQDNMSESQQVKVPTICVKSVCCVPKLLVQSGIMSDNIDNF